MTTSITPARTRETRSYRFPDGPKGNLLWKALKQLAPVEPLSFFEYLARAYGAIAQYRVGSNRVVFVNDPEYVREILVVQQENFVKERTVQRSKMLLGEGMITSEGSLHRAQRQAAQPAFHRQRIPAYAEAMVNCAAERRSRWRSGETLDIAQEMMQLTLEIAARTLFSTALRAEAKEIADAINSIMRLYNFLVILPAAEVLVHFPLPGVGTFKRARARLDRTVYRMIDQHRHNGDQGDLLSMMLRGRTGADDEQLRDEVITIFLAGYETVANSLTWTWYLLSQNPEAEQRLQAEVDEVLGGRLPSFADVPHLRYTEMVLAESMRMFPPAWAIGRKALNAFELGPYYLPAGTTVAASQWVMHRDPQYFPDPLRFDPERFTPEAKSARRRFTYLPFGAGSRQCIGEAFGWMEGVLLMATIAQQWRLQLVPGHRVAPQALITLRPKFGMLMHPEHRSVPG